MFEAIHSDAPCMIEKGGAKYADPSSLIRAGIMMMRLIGFPE